VVIEVILGRGLQFKSHAAVERLLQLLVDVAGLAMPVRMLFLKFLLELELLAGFVEVDGIEVDVA